MKQLILPTALAAFSLIPAMASACSTNGSGAKCVQAAMVTGGGNAGKWVKAPTRPLPFAAGDTLPRGQYNIVLNTEYHGLPPVQSGWLYYRVDRHVYRVDRRSMEVLELVRD